MSAEGKGRNGILGFTTIQPYSSGKTGVETPNKFLLPVLSSLQGKILLKL